MHGLVLGAVAASLLVVMKDVPSTCGKPPMPSVETPPRAETPRKALLGGDDELWEEQREEHGKSRRRPCTPPPLIHRGFANAEEALPRLAVEEAEEVARLKAQLEQLAFENESLHNLTESLNESLHTAAERKRTEASPSPGMLTGATEEASSVDRAPLATTRPSLASPAADERTAHVSAHVSRARDTAPRVARTHSGGRASAIRTIRGVHAVRAVRASVPIALPWHGHLGSRLGLPTLALAPVGVTRAVHGAL